MRGIRNNKDIKSQALQQDFNKPVNHIL